MKPVSKKTNGDSRALRFAKARLYEMGQRLMDCAVTPGFLGVWSKGWETSHAIRLARWKAAGFSPNSILDIGANQGKWSEMCEELYLPKSCSLVEPQKDLNEALARKAGKFHRNWKIFPVALGSRASVLDLNLTNNRAASSLLRPMEGAVPGEWGTKSESTVQVKVVRLDDLVAAGELPQPDLVKIDVQGFEAEVIAGGERTIEKSRRLVVEVSLTGIYEGQPLFYDVLKSLQNLGFTTDDITESCRSWPDGKLWQIDLWMRKSDE